ncbi:cytochrome c oxidase, cbb3-type, CcoQ subunit [Campylobacter gastrosuis]|uniref:Cytochrome c oxidase, cbb3-type, CcoQ subunit n=1 Tax=Campylobacter gastrosuis TaxID=2974576 RepID=A0ABT7HPI9_9BACT|nr:cytochrome c oxidase, cbb3-type, CcoQ subunit [Campylobacter gastrosuis]MDL0088841.1 cytochrome c oxidase, cbb3-type, CcoQ subunit [Campylobacter gastrosuis]
MDAQTIRELQAYGFFTLVVVMVFVLYGYFYHLYKSERTGRRNYEKYANLALDDDINGVVLEQNKKGL